MDVKMNLRIITRNLAADSKIVSHLEIDFRADCTHESNSLGVKMRVEFLKFTRMIDVAVRTRTGILSIRTGTNAVKIS